MNIQCCDLCPNMCGVNRNNAVGECGVYALPRIARVGLHPWEEPFISGTAGSGTVFFSGCSLRCVFCQNYDISSLKKGYVITENEFIEKLKQLVAMGTTNINFVTPTHYAHLIKKVLLKYRPPIPVVYNSSGFEKVETLKQLEGLIDIYLPDFKYFSPQLAKSYSGKENYPDIAKRAIDEMVRQTGSCSFSGEVLTRGTVIRHLVLPGSTDDSMNIIRYLYERYGDSVWLSVMNQYTPCGRASEFPPLDKPLKKIEYTRVVALLRRLGVSHCLIQEGCAEGACYIPPFSGDYPK